MSHYYRNCCFIFTIQVLSFLLKCRDRVYCHLFNNTDICILDATRCDAIATKKTPQGEEQRLSRANDAIYHEPQRISDASNYLLNYKARCLLSFFFCFFIKRRYRKARTRHTRFITR